MPQSNSRTWLSWTLEGIYVIALALLVVLSPQIRDAWDRWQMGRKVSAAWAELTTDGASISDGEETIVVFSDYQCPYCRSAMAALDTAKTANLKIIQRHLPLPMHPGASLLARASICAEPDPAFKAIDRALYSLDGEVATTQVVDLAKASGIADVVAYETCLQSPETTARLNRDAELAANLGISSTPTFASPGRISIGLPPEGFAGL